MSRINVRSHSPLARLSRTLSFFIFFVHMVLGGSNHAAQAPVRSIRQIEQYVDNYELKWLEPTEVLRQIKTKGSISFTIADKHFELHDLRPYDLRAPHYRAEAVTDGGLNRLSESQPVQSYKGAVRGIGRAQARFTLRDQTFEGVIFTPDEWYFIEPLRYYSASALAADMVVYKRSDIKPEILGTCGVSLIQRMNEGMEFVAPMIIQNALTGLVVELATEADHEYVSGLGGPASANNEILNIMSQVEGVYQTELSLSFQVVYQHTWGTASDPYSSTAPSTMLQEFTDHWNANFSNVSFDLAHLWTGKNLDGNTVGIAWKGVSCLHSHSYGLSQRIAGTPGKYIITAHEMGHNFGADHPDQTTHSECANTIMNSMVGTGMTFCEFSRDQINGHLAQNSGCLGADTLAPSNLTATPLSPSQIQLSWQDNSSNEAGFKVQRKTGSNGTWSQIATAGANITSYLNNGLTASTAYFYRVQSTGSGGDSAFSNEAAATTLGNPPSISGFSPASGPAGTSVSVTGANFTGATAVRFNTVDASTFSVVSSTQITAVVPNGAGTGPIRVTTPAGSGVSSNNFAVTQCSYSISSSSQAFAASGGSSILNITTSSGCPWTANSNTSWITINSGSNGSGNGSVSYTVGNNSSASPRNGTLTVAGQTFTVTQSGAQAGGTGISSIFVPIVLSSSGVNGSFFTSEMTLTNRGTQNATLSLTYASAIGGGSGTASDSLAAGRQRILSDAIGYLRSIGIPIPASGNQGGTLVVRFSGLSSSSDGAVTVRTTTSVSGGRAGLAYAGIPSSMALTGTSYLCGLRQNSADRSNVAIQNLGTSSEGNITLRLTVFSGNATTPFSKALPDEVLPPGGFKQISGILASNGMSLTNGYARVERISGTAPYYAYAVINDQFNSDGSFALPVLESSLIGRNKLTLPVIVETGSFSSELVVTNWSAIKKTLLCRYVADAIQASGLTASFMIEIHPSQQLIFPEFVQVLRDWAIPGVGPKGSSFVGAMFAEVSSGDLSGVSLSARTSSPGGTGRYGLFYSSVPNGAASATSTWIYGLQQNAENRSNLALVNTGETGASSNIFRIELFDGNTGLKINTIDGISVNAKAWKQLGTILAQYAPGTAQGYARVTRTAGNNPFIAYAVVNDGGLPGERTGDGAFVSAAP